MGTRVVATRFPATSAMPKALSLKQRIGPSKWILSHLRAYKVEDVILVYNPRFTNKWKELVKYYPSVTMDYEKRVDAGTADAVLSAST